MAYQYKEISDPQLPPRDGHVEDEDEHGNRVYRPVVTPQDIDIEALKKENIRLNSLIRATSESNAFLEECLVEMAGMVYA